MPFFTCPLCKSKRPLLKKVCADCDQLMKLVQNNLGQLGLGQLIDVLLETGIDKQKVRVFLESDPHGTGSIMDQITASLTNNLAEGMGIKTKDMTPQDVKDIRKNPMSGVSMKPLDH